MSKIANDGLSRSRTGCFIDGNSGRHRVNACSLSEKAVLKAKYKKGCSKMLRVFTCAIDVLATDHV